MSWTKKPQGGSAPPGAERQLYAPPQAQQYNNEQNLYQNYHTASTTSQQQFWPNQQPQFNQQYGQVFQPDMTANANQYYQPQQNFNQYNNPQSEYGQNLYQNQPIQQQNVTQKQNSDAWEDNWDWAWDEATKQAQKQQSMVTHHVNSQQPVFNNANVIEESFATSDNWNWSMDENKGAKVITQTKVETPPVTLPTTNAQSANNVVTAPTAQKSISNISEQTADIKTLNDREAIKEQLPNLALGKRFHLENLTPQWSIESQMSQDSSDGPQTHSEGTYRSENQSRSSNKSSPGLNTGSCNFNYSQPALDEYPNNVEWSKSNELALIQGVQNGSRRNSQDELAISIQKITLGNHESPIESLQESNILRDEITMPPSLAVTPSNFLPPMPSQTTMTLPRPPSSAGSLPRPPSSSGSLPRPPSSSGSLPPPPSSSANLPNSSASLLPPPLSVTTLNTNSTSNSTLPPPLPSTNLPPPNLPPPNFPPPSSSTNPFKHAGPFSHKTNNKSNANTTHMQFAPQIPNTNLISQAVVNKVSQHRLPLGFEANLETTPDNSERPDQPQMTPFRTMPVTQQVPENLEIAPQNDRNEYLQTAHLSGGDYSENTDFSRNVPPPGLRRMVVGQQETEYSQSLNMSGDEPPPGLARMVPGQQNETETIYNQAGNNYMDRQIDGQPTDDTGRPYRQADGQQTPDYTQSNTTSSNERIHLGLNRMVPGESSNNEYSQYQSSSYGGNEERVVTGVDHDFSMTIDAGPTDVREQNVDGSDYTEQITRNPPRNIIGARETSNVSPDFGVMPDEHQREVTMEGENLQDLSNIASTEMTFSRELIMDGSDRMIHETHKTGIDRKTDLSDSVEHPVTSSRRQSLNRTNTSGEESERDRTFKLSPRKDRDKHKSSRDRDRDRDRDKDRDRERDKEGRFSRSDRKYDRDERRPGRDDKRSEKEKRDRDRERDRRERDESPDGRRHRRSNRSRRYETEDTDYYSDKERERRHYREGSYASRPPRRDDKERRGSDKDRSRRSRDNATDRYRNYDDEWNGPSRTRRSAHYLQYRDIDPANKYDSLRKQRNNDKRRAVTFSSDANSINHSIKREGDQYSSPSRPESREATITDDDLNDSRRRTRRHQRPDPYYDGYGGAGVAGVNVGVGGGYSDAYGLQPQQYQYYELLRLTDPEAYMQVYKQVMAGHPPPAPPPHLYSKLLRDVYGEGYIGLGYDGRLEKRGGTNSVHSGRSSTTGLKGNDTLYEWRGESGRGSVRGAPSLRTELSDRDLNTDASLNLQLEESTVRSERMTPFRYSTAHIKGSVSSRHVVVVRGAYPVDGLPATVQVVSLQSALALDPLAAELAAYPGPLLKGVTHKKSVIEYCLGRVRSAAADPDAARDLTGYVLIWELLALLLRQNGVVVGSDIAELLMKNSSEYEYRPSANKTTGYEDGRCGSRVSAEVVWEEGEEARNSSPEQRSLSISDVTRQELRSPGQAAAEERAEERAALDRLREYLIYGNRQEALEWAMSQQLWGHALQLAAHADRRTRASVSARFVSAQAHSDPLHTLYAALAGSAPPAATCVSDERWGDWRPHAAILLSNSSSRPDQDRKTLTQLGDSLSSRGLLYSAQFCYVSAGVPFSAHPLAPLQPRAAPAALAPAPAAPAHPPRLSLLLAEPRANSLGQFATNKAIFATEIYEYALSLSQDYVLAELQVYKVVAAARLCDCGQYERALAYAERAARVLTRAPHCYSGELARVLAELADRLQHHEPAPPHEEPDSAEPSPTHDHAWIHELNTVARALSEQSRQETPQHHTQSHTQPHTPHHEPPHHHETNNHHYGWAEQAQHYQQPIQTYPETAEETPDYAANYYGQQAQQIPQQVIAQVGQQMPQQIGQQDTEPQPYPTYVEDWHKTEEHHAQSYADPYWQPDSGYGYGEAGVGEEAGAGAGAPRAAISMPGATPAAYRDYDDDRPPSSTEQPGDRNQDSPKSIKKPDSASKDDQQKSEGKQRSGWLGGILTKLSLRPPNQMILPDDKNPSIVWDEDKKRWRNLDGDTDETERPPPPPPRTAELPPALRSGSPPLQATPGAPAASAAPVSNIFKMQKGRHIKKSYVDVFNPRGAPTRPLPPAAEVLGPATPLGHIDQLRPVTYLVPAPAPQGAQPGHVSIPICLSRTPTPAAPIPVPQPPTPSESGIYDPTQVGGEDDQYRSGI